MRDLNEILSVLARSRFRASFRVGAKERQYLKEKGLDIVIEHARQFVTQRLGGAHPTNDGRQTPFKGHPVFIAQHATATCCRKCLAKWHQIPPGKKLTEEQVDYIVGVIRQWIEKQSRCGWRA